MNMRQTIAIVEAADRLTRKATLKNGIEIKLVARKWEPDLARFPDETETTVLLVCAVVDEATIGYAEFYLYGTRSGSVEDVSVVPEFRRMGVASAMYDYLKSLGLQVDPSEQRLEPDGRAFWQARKA